MRHRFSSVANGRWHFRLAYRLLSLVLMGGLLVGCMVDVVEIGGVEVNPQGTPLPTQPRPTAPSRVTPEANAAVTQTPTAEAELTPTPTAEVFDPTPIVNQELAAATAVAASTSTAKLDYANTAAEQLAQWNALGIEHYKLSLRFAIPGIVGSQLLELEVDGGEIVAFKHDCFPEQTCVRARLEQNDFTIPGIFAMLDELAAEQAPLAILSFDETYFFPTNVTINSDLGWGGEFGYLNVQEFEVLEEG